MSELPKQACAISFTEKVQLFSNDYLKLCRYIAGANTTTHYFTKKLYSMLITASSLLEDFLDFHGAKNNNNWYFYRELSAGMRHLALAGYSQKHITNRLQFYYLGDTEKFEAEGARTHDFIYQALRNLAPAVLEEANRLNIAIPSGSYHSEDFPGVTTSEILPPDIVDMDKGQQKQNIVKIAGNFLKIAEHFDSLDVYTHLTLEQMEKLVPDQVNEVEVRRYEMLVHNLQSSFDTYVIHGGYLHGNRKLKTLRGYFSVVFHLLQIVGRMLHFYERHLHEAGYKDMYKKVQDTLCLLVNADTLVERTVNYGLYYVCRFLSAGRDLATEILNENIERTVISVNVPMNLGFHLRPSLLVTKVVQHYGGQVELVINGDRFDAGSVLDIQWAGGKIQKEGIREVSFEGDSRALRDIRILAANNYGEDTMGKDVPLPDALSYLRAGV